MRAAAGRPPSLLAHPTTLPMCRGLSLTPVPPTAPHLHLPTHAGTVVWAFQAVATYAPITVPCGATLTFA